MSVDSNLFPTNLAETPRNTITSRAFLQFVMSFRFHNSVHQKSDADPKPNRRCKPVAPFPFPNHIPTHKSTQRTVSLVRTRLTRRARTTYPSTTAISTPTTPPSPIAL